MTPEDFRRLALAMPGVIEASHMGTTDFRLAGKIFATLGFPDEAWGMVKLQRYQQKMLVAAEPSVFRAVPGGWGRRGSTNVCLSLADEVTLTSAMRDRAPKRSIAGPPRKLAC